MLALFETVMRIINGVITLTFFPLLFNLFKLTNRRFFLYWSLGFLFYGVNIMLRVFASEIVLSKITLFIFFLTIIGFVLIVTGIGELIGKTKYLLTMSLILPFLLVVQYLAGGNWQHLIWFIVLSPCCYIVLSLIGIMWFYKYDLKLLLSGWMVILIINMAYAFDMMNAGFIDLLSTVAKIMIYWGMTDPRFAFIVDDLDSFIIGGMATEYHLPEQGRFALVNLANHNREKEIMWIRNRVKANNRKGIRTILISYYGLITPQDISLDKDTYFVNVQAGSKGVSNPFEEKVITIGDDLAQLDLLFSDIIKISSDLQIGTEIIVYTLSSIIHTHGWRRLYAFLTTKLPLIKNSLMQLTCFYYPETHETAADIVKFEMLADEILK